MKQVRLNRKLQLESPQRTGDGAGGFTEAWEVLGTLWAEVTPRSGRLVNGETGPVSSTGYRISVRATPAGSDARPVPGQRFRMGTRVFGIEAVTELEPRGAYLTCQCEEEVAP